MESRDPVPLSTPIGFGARLLGALIGGFLFAAVGCVVAGFMLGSLGPALRHPEWPASFREFLRSGGWLWLPLCGSAISALRAIAWAANSAQRLATAGLAIALLVLPALVRPEYSENQARENPRTPSAKSRAILRWSYQSPEAISNILELSRDPDPQVREQAVLALGVNLIVTDIEKASMIRPSRYRNHPLRRGLGARLLEILERDSVEAVRAEAARALWKAPETFGRQPAAADTLAEVLRRASRGNGVERLAWLALDAAAGAPNTTLKAAAARFAAATSDTDLSRAARLASASSVP